VVFDTDDALLDEDVQPGCEMLKASLAAAMLNAILS